MSSIGSSNGDPVILATASYDHTIRFWQAHSGVCHRTVQHGDSQVNALEITPDRQHIAAAGYQHIRMFDLNSTNLNPVINYDGISKNVTAVGFRDDGKWMYTGGEDSTARIWDIRSRNLQCQRLFQMKAPVNTVCLHPNQGELFIGDQSGALHIWDIKSDKNEKMVPEPGAAFQSISIDPEGNYLAAINNKGKCYVWRMKGGINDQPTELHPEKQIEAHRRYGLKCQFSPDSTLLATTSADCTVRIWRTADFSLMTELKDHSQRWVWDCAFSGDSQYIITASSDNMARLWNVETAEVKREYSGHQKAVVCLAFRDDISE